MERPTSRIRSWARLRLTRRPSRWPNECWVHLGAGNGIKEVAGVRIVEDKIIQPDQFWIGVNNDQD